MAINLLDTIVYKGKKPNFSRDQFATLAEMTAYPEFYLPDTFIATCIEDGNAYLFNRKNETRSTTGKWRKLIDSGADPDIISGTQAENMFKK